MDKFVDLLEKYGTKAYDIVWHDSLVIVLLLGGLYFTIRTRAVQIRRVKTMAKLLFTSGGDDKGVSSFQAFALSVAGRVGTGNIAGVATAIAAGGPGALFWMWVIATLGSATAYVESTLGQLYKEEVDGEFRGGPAYYFEKISGKRFLGVIFAVITIISMGLFLPGVQANSIADAVQKGFASSAEGSDITTIKLVIGIAVALLLGFVIFGGTKRLAKSAEFIVPFMSGAYMLIAITIIILEMDQVPEMLKNIFQGAFSPSAALGGVAGLTIMEVIKSGVKRGLYSNEAGQGTGPHAAASASVNHPAEQGLVQSFSVYFDTLLVCSATGFMILLTKSYYVTAGGNINVFKLDKAAVENGTLEAGPAFTQNAVSTLLGDSIGPKFVAIALFFFAFTTLMAYYYMAECNIAYLSTKKNADGTESSSKVLILVTRIMFLVAVIAFSTLKVGFVWTWADVGVGVMAWYNVIGILAVSLLCKAPTIKVLNDYEDQLKQGVEKATFDPEKLGIKNTDVW